MSFRSCDYFHKAEFSIPVHAICLLLIIIIIKTPLLCCADVKLSSVQCHSESLHAEIAFSDSVLSELISAEHSDWCCSDLSGPLLSLFPANLAGEGAKLTLISTDQNIWGRVKTF